MVETGCSGTAPAVLEIFRRPFDMDSLLVEMKKYERIHLERRGVDYGTKFPHTFGTREYWMKQYGIDSVELRK